MRAVRSLLLALPVLNIFFRGKKKISPAINSGVMKHDRLSIQLSVVYKLGSKRTCGLWAGTFLFMKKSQRWALFKAQALDSDCSPSGCHSPPWICHCLSLQQRRIQEGHLVREVRGRIASGLRAFALQGWRVSAGRFWVRWLLSVWGVAPNLCGSWVLKKNT